jgi:tetratricopeptide (TPR) repeat protein
MGSAHFQQGNYSAAIGSLQAGLRLKPNDAEGLFDLGNAYYKIGRLPDAVATYNKAIAQPSWEKWPAINNIGLIKYEQGDVDEAIKQWQAALAIEKQAAEPQMAMAVALYSQGKQEQAFKMGETALRSDGRYGDLDFLKLNLWGNRLLGDTKKFLETPRMQAALQQRQNQAAPAQEAP